LEKRAIPFLIASSKLCFDEDVISETFATLMIASRAATPPVGSGENSLPRILENRLQDNHCRLQPDLADSKEGPETRAIGNSHRSRGGGGAPPPPPPVLRRWPS
jgi:hypothetical protein